MADLSKQVKKLALEEAKKVKEKEIYLSPKFKRHIQSLVDSVLLGRKKKPTLTIDYNTDVSADVAYTTGNDIYLNAGNHISNTYTLQENRMLTLFGIAFHECAHILFLDFDKENKIKDALKKKGEFYGEFTGADEKTIDELLKTVREEKTRPVFVKFYHELSNIFSDVHDESKICHKFHGIVERGITLVAEAIRSQSISVEKITERYSENPNPANALEAIMSLILQFARYGEFVIENDEETSSSNEFLLMMEDLTNTIVVGCTTDDLEEKYTAINKCLLVLWPYIKEILDNAENSDSSSGSDGSEGSGNSEDATDKAVKSILESIEAATEKAIPSKSKAPEELKPQPKTKSKEKESPDTEGKSMDEKTAADMAKNIIEQIKKEIGEEKAEERVEKDIKKSVSEVVSSVNLTSSHKGRPIQQIRRLDVSLSDKNLYNQIMRELAPISKALQRQMLNALRDVKEEDILKHRNFGSKLEARDTYRLDSRFFSKKKAPSNVPNMAIAVLVDLSGSMSGNRIESARKAAMLLYDFAKGLGIPVMVAGHTENYYGLKEFQYYRFAEFDSVNDKDRYRLSQIEAHSNNRDGMALQITSELLLKRPEETKLLIIISDGQPAADNYGGEAAIKDMQEIVRSYKRKGIETFAAAIGSDRDTIRNIYKDGYIDIDDLYKLPKALVKLVKKRII